MAQLLYERQSSDFHLNAVRRHMRLCRQIKGGEQYATRIKSFVNDLDEKQKLSEKAKLDKEIAYDNVILNDNDLDNVLRTLFEKCKQYDRENPGRPVLKLIFTDGKLSTIIYAPLESEPDMASQLIARLAALPAGNQLAELSTAIKANIDKCKASLLAYHNAITAQKSAEATEEISKSNLRRQYEFNNLDMVKEFGKQNANRFFPVIGTSGKSTNDERSNGDSTETKSEKP
jgi:hypothetical protein